MCFCICWWCSVVLLWSCCSIVLLDRVLCCSHRNNNCDKNLEQWVTWISSISTKYCLFVCCTIEVNVVCQAGIALRWFLWNILHTAGWLFINFWWHLMLSINLTSIALDRFIKFSFKILLQWSLFSSEKTIEGSCASQVHKFIAQNNNLVKLKYNDHRLRWFNWAIYHKLQQYIMW